MKGKILIVEDDKQWQTILKQCLCNAGYYTAVDGDVESALEVIEKEKFHFITTGMSLADDNLNPEEFGGWKVLKKINQLRINKVTPVMVLTGLENAYLQSAMDKGLEATFFMAKRNFDKEKLIEIINREVERIDLRFLDDHREVE
jgi:CheY-like chemotaxis protein